jgi:hypothetical protein
VEFKSTDGLELKSTDGEQLKKRKGRVVRRTQTIDFINRVMEAWG